MDKTCDHCGMHATEFASVGPNQDWCLRCVMDSRDAIAEQRDQLWAALDDARARLERYEALDDELGHARKKFPRNRRLLTALMEEVGELAKALLQRDPNWKKEALQCACVAMRIYEEGDADFDNVTDEEAQP